MRRVLSLALIVVLGILAACSSAPPAKPSTSTEPVSGSTGKMSGAGANEAGSGSLLTGAGHSASGDAALLAERKVYFDFDSSEIKPTYAPMIAEHGKWLALNRKLRLRLEGNTDERGSAEYNVGLGERRAQAVKRALLLQGALDSQIVTVSYGEERPAAEGHTEEAWSQNRRVDFIPLNDR